MGLFDGYLDQLAGVESGGRNVGSPTSSAFGPYQFLDKTWRNLAAQHPELGLTPEDRYSPDAQRKAIQAFTADNASVLKNAGIDATPSNLYMAHFLGAGGGAKFLKAMQDNPNAPAASFVSADVVDANKGVFLRPDGTPKTLGEVYSNFDKKFGGNPEGTAALFGLPGASYAGLQPAAAAAPSVAPQPDQPAISDRVLSLIAAMQPKPQQVASTPIETPQAQLLRSITFQKSAS